MEDKRHEVKAPTVTQTQADGTKVQRKLGAHLALGAAYGKPVGPNCPTVKWDDPRLFDLMRDGIGIDFTGASPAQIAAINGHWDRMQAESIRTATPKSYTGRIPSADLKFSQPPRHERDIADLANEQMLPDNERYPQEDEDGGGD